MSGEMPILPSHDRLVLNAWHKLNSPEQVESNRCESSFDFGTFMRSHGLEGTASDVELPAPEDEQ